MDNLCKDVKWVQHVASRFTYLPDFTIILESPWVTDHLLVEALSMLRLLLAVDS